MKKILISLPEIKLLGIQTVTNNQDEFSGNGKIGPFINNYFANNIAGSILNKKNPGIAFFVYSDYQDKHHGDYKYFIGEEVLSYEGQSHDLCNLSLPQQEYIRFTTKSGPAFEVVPEAWQKIWQMDDKELGGKRSYMADFEIYHQKNEDEVIVDIYVGVRVF
jgi:predicted transcriptional regulator YdeE